MKSNEHIINHIVWSKNDTTEEIFSNIYNKNLWQSENSKSGKGSEINETKTLIRDLKSLFKKYNIRTIVDAPCGDFNWFRYVVSEIDEYYGIDIVEKLINNNKIYETDKIRFAKGDITNCDIPEADLILCRDCFIHLNFEQIKTAMNNFKKSNCKYILTTSYDIKENVDVITGQFRKINLTVSPFNFPKPVQILFDDVENGKYLCLWRLSDL